MKKLFIIFAVLCLAAPAMAADWNFYGSARFATFWIDDDSDVAGEDSDSDLQWNQQGNSRIGANVKFNDEIGGRFEMSDNFGKRILYGTYNFGAGQLLIGQTYAPSAIFASNSVFDGDGDLLGIGEFYEGRLPMIQATFGGFQLALIKADVDGVGDQDLDVSLPKIEAAYTFKADMFKVTGFAGYHTYEVTQAGVDYDVDSYVAGIGAGMNFGPIFVNLGAHIGQNLGNYGAYQPYINQDAGFGATDTLDNDAFGWLAVVGFNVSEMITLEAGYGYTEAELDDSNNTQDAQQIYLNATINITKGFFIVPEIGMQTISEDASPEEPERFYVGAKWQINF
ncbi:hypothetical protein [Desulfosarcina sp.]|uniref:hypothetical protein n=1 Tax=Desulfosarcina sp. TaxID=2027861 RepID=UPI003970B3C8